MINKRIIIHLLLFTTLLTTACLQPKLLAEKARGFICASLPVHDEPVQNTNDDLEPVENTSDDLEPVQKPSDPLEQVQNTKDDLAIAWQHNIDLLYHVYKSQVIPEHLQTEQPVFRGAEFKIMRIFEFLDHLSMLPGYQLAYSYYYQSSFAGNPILYACEAPFYGTPDSTNCHRNHLYYVVTDGSELGYLQWILLTVMGDQFYIYWHADYGKDKLLVATDEALSKILLRIEDDLDEQQKAQAGLINPQPRVMIGEDTVTIRVVWFTKFGGFFETIYQVNKDHPHTTKMLETNSLLEYDCGIMY